MPTKTTIKVEKETRDRMKEVIPKSQTFDQALLEWVNLADLFRIKGVAEEYSDLLEEAGVDTVAELALEEQIIYMKKYLKLLHDSC